MTETVTVSAKIDVQLKKKMDELDIKPSETIRKALEREVEERTKEKLKRQMDEASEILSKLSGEEWTKAIREGRDLR
jgi:hypothetical protein